MADAPQQQQQQQQQQNRMQAPFPTPPPFYQHFTKANLAQLHQARKAAAPAPTTTTTNANNGDDLDPSARSAEGAPQPNGLNILSLPPELRYLLPPPPPPSNAPWLSFGATHTLDPSTSADRTLASLSIPRLYPTTTTPSAAAALNPQPHLIALSRSLLTTFLSLLGQLAQNPTDFEARTRDLEEMVMNMHELINAYRPHQARESLVGVMEERVRRLRGEVEGIRGMRGRVEGVLGGFGGEGEDGRLLGGEVAGGVVAEGKEGGGKDEGRRRARQRAAWDALEREMEMVGEV